MLLHLLLCIAPVLILLTLIRNYTLLPSSIPGPFLALFTNIYRLLSVFRISPPPHEYQLDLHNRYGDIVRLGPNTISLQGPQFTQQIYGITGPAKNMRKSGFYSCFQNIVNGKRAASLVAMTDETEHARTKRAIAHAYSLSKLVEFEVLVDSTTKVFLETLSARFAKPQEVCDLGRWLQFFAFDVIGELTFSKRLGFLETGEDVNGIIAAIGANFRYFSVLGQMPWLDNWLGKNPIYIKFFRKPVSSPILLFAQNLLQERLDQLETGTDDKDASAEEVDAPDFLSKFLSARKDTDSPELMGDRQLLSYLFMNINAGSDTIASTLKGIFYGLLMNPSAMKKLLEELEDAKGKGNLTSPTPTWQETQNLPYLSAVIKEGLRLNPALSLSLERVVPPEGLILQTSTDISTETDTTSKPTSSPSTLYVPPGTVIGINPYVQHHDPRIFSPSPSLPASQFNPSRWLFLPSTSKSTSESTQIKSMDHALLSFGAGKRSCLGKNVAMLELHKLVPALLMRFSVEWAEGYEQGRGWRVVNKWVLEQQGLMVRLTERRGVGGEGGGREGREEGEEGKGKGEG